MGSQTKTRAGQGPFRYNHRLLQTEADRGKRHLESTSGALLEAGVF